MTKRDWSAVFLAIALDFPEFFYWNQYEIKRVQQNEDGTVFSFEMSYHYKRQGFDSKKNESDVGNGKRYFGADYYKRMTEAEMVRAV